MLKTGHSLIAALWATSSAVLLVACQGVPPPPPPAPAPATPPPTPRWTDNWHAWALPGKPETHYSAGFVEDRWVLHAQSERSASMFRRMLQREPQTLGTVSFSWRVESLIDGADVRENHREDAPVRVMLAFDGDHTRLSPRTRVMFDLMHTLTGEAPPFATLMYTWDNQASVDSLVVNRRSDRVRKIVLESGPAHLGQWRSYQRDIRADFRRAFGEDPGVLLGVAVMTDSDNTQSRAEAWYGEITIE